ncbi:MAG: hypothetical protein JWM99_379 [Verrucomicrobiales bacterium]|jgi:hypothetical protein|nr:hypothetical protein [Verrucomicrobiales bacterium]
MKHKTLRFFHSIHRAKLAMMLFTAFSSFSLVRGQSFDAGSDGSLGDVVISADTAMDLPPDGKLRFRSLTVDSGATLRFNSNLRNTPVFILSQSNVLVNGTINVDGGRQTANTGGVGGPGGFAGGKPGFGPEVPPGAGYGPGGSPGGQNNCSPVAGVALGGSYGNRQSGAAGETYGNTLLIPLVGGSGGGGGENNPAGGGGGGGGAVLIAANTRITINGSIFARGGAGGFCLNGGSGGAIRLVAFQVEGAGALNAGGLGGGPTLGRVRVDTVIRTGLNLTISGVSSIGGNLLVFPSTTPTLTVTEAAGNPIPNGSGPVVFTLPFGSSPNRTIKIQARDFARNVPIRVTLTPDSGSILTFDAEVNNSTANPAVVDVPVTVPVNTLVTVHCWTR